MQIRLPKALRMHPGDQLKRLTEHATLPVRQHRLRLDGAPALPQTFGGIEPVEQQPATLTLVPALPHQRRCWKMLVRQQLRTSQLTPVMTLRLATHHELGQDLATIQTRAADIALPGQDTQPKIDMQIRRIRQLDLCGVGRLTPASSQLGQPH